VTRVAPRRGAWIETFLSDIAAIKDDPVAPRRGAWIETIPPARIIPATTMSHPAGVRGLKPAGPRKLIRDVQSHPAGVRGLKQLLLLHRDRDCAGRTPQGCVD